MFQGSEKFTAKIDILRFINKRLIEVLKIEKQKKNRDKKLNLLGEKINSSQLFSLSKISATQKFLLEKKVDKEQHKKDIKKKIIIQKKKV